MTYDPRTYWPERYAAQGDTYVAKGGDPDSYVEQLEAIDPILRTYLPTTGRVLDFGCGPGRFRPTLESMGLEYEGFDIIPGLGNVPSIQFDRYDCAIAVYVLQHIVDAAEYVAALVGLWSGLRRGGILLVVDARRMQSPAPHMNPRGAEGVLDVFRREHIITDGPDAHWVGVFQK